MPDTRFIDIPWPRRIVGYPTSATVVWNTSIVASASGDEHANQNWRHPKIKIDLPDAIREAPDYEALKEHNYRTRGPFRTFPFKDPTDFASVPLRKSNIAPPLSNMDVQIGVGDGLTKRFNLIKKYAAGTAEEYQRRIYLPVVDSVLVSVNGVAAGAHTVSRPGGVVEFAVAPGNGVIIRAGFLFDVPVRYESDDSLAGAVKTYLAGGFGSFGLVSVKPCDWD